MQVSIFDNIQPTDPNSGMHVREGGANREIRVLFKDDAPDGFNFWLARTVQNDEGDDAFQSPRHKHTFQQIKFAERGEIDVSPGLNIAQGEMGYFPKGAYYGPQKREKGLVSIVCQYGFNGEHQRGEYWESRRADALQRLKSRGVIENGLFVERDEKTGETRVRDAVDALYDERHQMLKGKPLKIPAPMYEAPILLHPANAEYFAVSEGVRMKHLGRFFDQPGPHGDVGISMVQINGGTLELAADRPQIAWTLDDGLVADGQACSSASAIYCPRGEAGTLSSDGMIELYLVEFPRLD